MVNHNETVRKCLQPDVVKRIVLKQYFRSSVNFMICDKTNVAKKYLHAVLK